MSNLVNLDLSSNDIHDNTIILFKLPELKHLKFLNISNCEKLIEILSYLVQNIKINLKINC